MAAGDGPAGGHGGWRIGEAPVAYRSRAGGQSKVSGSVRGSLRAVRDMSAVLRELG